MARIAYLGPEGTFTEAALSNMAAAGVVPAGFTPVPMDSTPAALEAVRSGAADLACVPIENSIEGACCRPWTAWPPVPRCRSTPN